MKYTYTVYLHGVRRDITTNFVDVEAYVKGYENFRVEVFDNIKNSVTTNLLNQTELFGWRTSLEREASWKPKITEHKPYNALEEIDGFHVKEGFTSDTLTLGKLKPEINKAVNPSHYQTYMWMDKEFTGESRIVLQWLEAQQFLPRFRNPDVFKGAIELQARKYLDRLGEKDNEVQEILKSIWYLKFLAAYIANGSKPIKVSQIDDLLRK